MGLREILMLDKKFEQIMGVPHAISSEIFNITKSYARSLSDLAKSTANSSDLARF